jgi:hypothetical protein
VKYDSGVKRICVACYSGAISVFKEDDPRELRTLSCGEILQPTNRALIRSRAGPAGRRESLPDVFFYVENLRAVGPPWFEYRGPPDRIKNTEFFNRLS